MEIGAGSEAGAFFQDGAEFAVSGARVSGGFEDDERAFFEEWSDRLAGVEHVAEVRFAEVVEWCGYAENDSSHLADAGKIGGGLQFPGVSLGGNFLSGNVLNIAFSGIDGVRLAWIDVQSEDSGSRTCKLQR